MASIVIGNSGYSPAVHTYESFSVWVKRDWGSTWIRVPYLIPRSFEETAFPNIGSARLRWEYGEYVNRWYHSGGTLLPVNLENWLIKIVVHSVYGSYIGFIGVVIGETMSEEGVSSTTGLPTGYQDLECHDISVLLRRRKVLGTFVGDGENWAYLKRTRGVNVGESHRDGRVENRSLNYNSEAGCYMYEDPGVPWSNGRFAEYLLACFQPWYPLGNTAGGVVTLAPIFRLSGQVDALLNLYGEYRPWGKDVFSMLDQLIDRRRGFGAHMVTDGDGPIYIEVYSLSEYPISGLGAYVPANPRQGYVPTGGDHHIQATYQITEMRAVDEIVVESDEPIKVMATWGFDDASLEPGWTSEIEEEFRTATDAEREADYYAAVYTKFQVPKLFDFSPWIPGVDDFGNVDTTENGAWWHHDMGVERFLPIEETGGSSTETQYVEPFALVAENNRIRDLAVQLSEDGSAPYNLAGAQAATNPEMTEGEFGEISTNDTTITDADLLAAIAAHPFEFIFTHKAAASGHDSCYFQPGDTGLSFYVKGYSHNLTFAHNRFTGSSSNSTEFDYKTLLATMFFRTDEMLRVRLPIWTGTYTDAFGRTVSETNPQGRQVHIVIPGQECWVAAPYTVTDIDTGDLVYYNDEAPDEAVIIRNDIERIRWAALVAYVWYGTPRATVRLHIANHLHWFRIGDLIRATLSGFWWERVGTVVTSIAHDCENQSQTVTTAFGEMDPEAVVQEAGKR